LTATDSFNYTLSDGNGGTSNTATVTITIDGVNDINLILGNNRGDNIAGTSLADEIRGLAGRDTLSGREGNDSLLGESGADTLNGNSGLDALTGGTENDVFVLRTNAGTDTVTDFQLGSDLLGLAGGLQFSSLSFANEAVKVGNRTLAILDNVDAESLTETDFVVI
jgi:Ca2+-binding RTX toxin-like protein